MSERNPDKPMDILVIDDELAVRNLLEGLLGMYKVKVDTAKDGKEGLDMYEKRYNGGVPYDAVFTDLTMPELDGTGVIRRIKGLSQENLVYVITDKEATLEYEELEKKLGELKPDGVIQKPFLASTIRSLVEEIQSKKCGTGTQQGLQL